MKRKRRVTRDEKALWQHTMRGVERMHDGQPEELSEDHAPTPRKPASAPRGSLSAKPKPSKSKTSPKHKRAAIGRPAKPNVPSQGKVFGGGDPRQDRRVSRGAQAIDAVLDLHGHRQSTAITTLRQFVHTASARGHRCVLVITGKGAPEGAEYWSVMDARELPGVLNRRFREWVEASELKPLISRVSPAHARHGGRGAFYIFLKKRH